MFLCNELNIKIVLVNRNGPIVVSKSQFQNKPGLPSCWKCIWHPRMRGFGGRCRTRTKRESAPPRSAARGRGALRKKPLGSLKTYSPNVDRTPLRVNRYINTGDNCSAITASHVHPLCMSLDHNDLPLDS